jgi:hypothetical protein
MFQLRLRFAHLGKNPNDPDAAEDRLSFPSASAAQIQALVDSIKPGWCS